MNPPADAPYRNPALPPDERVHDLLSRMTLEEKVAQMTGIWKGKAERLVDEQGGFDAAKARTAFPGGHGLGQVGRPSDSGGGRKAREMAELTNAIQRFFIEESRLGIPVMFHEECLHGLAAEGATSFPQPIALAGSFDPSLVEDLYAMIAAEARLRGAHHALTPVVDVARDPRWGRVEETFGEDPHLAGRMGVAAVRGFQGDATFRDRRHVIATLKHFAAHGQPESGINCAPVNVSERVLREVFLPPFEQAIREGGAIAVMASYNEIDAVPSHANPWLLRDVLRGEWGFKGFVVSDYYALTELHVHPVTQGHYVAADKKGAALLGVRAGVNLELPEPDCYPSLVELVREGTLAEAELDELIAPMLLWKFKLGLFDDPYVDPDEAQRYSDRPEHRDLALRAARECITLLKNDGGLLPLAVDQIRTLAVIGPNADRSLLGGYSGVPDHDVSVLDGIRQKVGGEIEVLHSEGCKITVGGSWIEDEVIPGDPEEDRRMIAEAVEVAARADAIVLAIGGNEQTSREAWSTDHMGDRTSLELFGRQDELVRAMVATGKPVVVLLFNGRPLSIRETADQVPAILECWYLGQETGRAVADVLFGDHNPGGKLPISVPRSVGHIPAYYNHKPTAKRGYLFDETSPLFAFGFGLSYTTFRLENLRLERDEIAAGETTRVLVDVENTGPRDGTEVIQMYVRDLVSSVTRPVKELKCFRKVALKPGERTTVSLEIGPSVLAFHDIHRQFRVEPGEFRIMVGTSSRDEDLAGLILRVR